MARDIRLYIKNPELIPQSLMERPEQIPEEVWQWLPALPFEYSGWCAILPLPRVILDKICPAAEVAPADIRVENLSIAYAEVAVGQANTVSVTVKNYGGQAGSKTITCNVNGITSSQTVTLNAGKSQQVNFSVTPQEAKTYQVSVNGLTGSFKATTAAPPGVADIRVENLVITPAEVNVEEKVTISVTATNYGTLAGSKTITCTVT